jgi:hypothetical protein
MNPCSRAKASVTAESMPPDTSTTAFFIFETLGKERFATDSHG